eukprot:scaffold44393_cov19-Tisochrysis_lutea.AAC.1
MLRSSQQRVAAVCALAVAVLNIEILAAKSGKAGPYPKPCPWTHLYKQSPPTLAAPQPQLQHHISQLMRLQAAEWLSLPLLLASCVFASLRASSPVLR